MTAASSNATRRAFAADFCVCAKVRRDVVKAQAEPDAKEKFVSFGSESYSPMRDQLLQYMAAESMRFADVINKAGPSPD